MAEQTKTNTEHSDGQNFPLPDPLHQLIVILAQPLQCRFNHIKDLSNCEYQVNEISKKQVLIPKIFHKMTSHHDTHYSRNGIQVGSLQTYHPRIAG